MSTVSRSRKKTSEAAIFARLWEQGDTGLSPGLARHVLRLRFAEQDQTRMRALVARNRDGRLSAQEVEELDNYIKVGDLLAIIQSKARKLLKRKSGEMDMHG